jgi:hypothetical protein
VVIMTASILQPDAEEAKKVITVALEEFQVIAEADSNGKRVCYLAINPEILGELYGQTTTDIRFLLDGSDLVDLVNELQAAQLWLKNQHVKDSTVGAEEVNSGDA